MNELGQKEVKEQVLIDKLDQKDNTAYITNLNILVFISIVIIILSTITVLKLKGAKKKKEITEKDLESEHYKEYKKALKSLDRDE